MFGAKAEGPERTGLQAGEVDEASGWDCDVDHLAESLIDQTDPTGLDRHLIPRDLDEWLPGPYLAALLSSLDFSLLNGDDVVTVTRAWDRLLSHAAGRRYTGIAEIAHCFDPETTQRSSLPEEFATEEVGAALTLTRRRADDELALALDLRHRLPSVASALDRGDIDSAKTRLLCRDTAHLEADAARRVTDELLETCPQLTTGQLRARLRKLTVEESPTDATARYERSLTERKVMAEPNWEGTAALIISQCSPRDVYAARDHINILAKRLKTEDEPRSIDELRADVALGLLTGSINGDGSGGGHVVITTPLTTLAELDSQTGDLAGYGPVHAELARKIAREQLDSEWIGVVTDPDTGEPLHAVALRRRPTARQRRMIRALLPHCSFPSCRMPARDCDIDHTVDYAEGGPTTVCNQVPLCRRHHLAKHRGRWTYRRLDRTTVRWTSPLGRRYDVRARSP
ncbi:MAG: DUF222 domain-containing protein [Acidimicrobiia bacterium]|jgi:hypothetical protein